MRANPLNVLQRANAKFLSELDSIPDLCVVTVFRGNGGQMVWEKGQHRTEWAIHLFFPSDYPDNQIESFIKIYGGDPIR